MEQKYIVAFEIGSASIKGAIATTQPGMPGRVNILAVETEHLVDKVRYGCVENPGDVATCVTSICHKLQAAPGVSPRAIKQVYVGISGRSLASYPHEVARDFHAEIEITRRTVDDLMQQAAARSIPEREIVAIEPGSFSVDSQTSLNPVGMFGHLLSAQVSLVACKPKIRNNIKRVFNERCALNIAGYVVTPLAMGTQLLTDEERRLGVMLVDFGAETTTVAIYREGVLVYLATIPMGSRNITRDITSLNCLEERAEEIKKAVGNAMPAESGAPLVTDGLDNSEINNIIAARADEIISNIFEQISYADLKPSQLPAGIVVTGGGAQLRGFNELLAKQTQMKTRPATLGTGVTLADHRFSAANLLDVISIINEAAMINPIECTMMPPQSVPEQRVAEEQTSTVTTANVNVEDDETHRIGSYDDEDDDVLKDQEDTPNVKKPATNSGKKTPTTKGGDNDATSSGFWAKLGQSLNKMMKDDTDFEG